MGLAKVSPIFFSSCFATPIRYCGDVPSVPAVDCCP